MKSMKRVLAFLITASMLAGGVSIPASAATRKKITSVSIDVEAEPIIGGEIDPNDLNVECNSEKYSVGDYEFLNEGFEWAETDVPQAKIYIYAAEGYYFSFTKASSVKIKGADYVKAVKEDSSRTLILTVKLPPLSESIGEIESAQWDSVAHASWTKAPGAGVYEVKIYRNGNPIGGSRRTNETSYDFTKSMSRSGTYSFKVRPINKVKETNKGEWVEAGTVEVSLEMAERIREAIEAGVPFENKGEWIEDAKGRWYRNPDGTYTSNNWQLIDNEWFFFDANGYAMTGWVDWQGKSYYCEVPRGNMLVDTTTPDGYKVGADGAWIQ